MADSPTTAAANKATKVADPIVKSAVDGLNKTLPTVVETAEVAMQVPSKVVLNQKLIVTVSILGGAVLGAGALAAFSIWKQKRHIKKVAEETEKLVHNTIEELNAHEPNPRKRREAAKTPKAAETNVASEDKVNPND